MLDAGPLVAALSADDDHHEWAAEQLGRLEPPLLTCEAVLTEAFFLLRRAAGGAAAIWQLVERGAVEASFRLKGEEGQVARLMARYANVPMSLADACLVRMSEIHEGARVLTLDDDFRIYRKRERKVVPTISPR